MITGILPSASQCLGQPEAAQQVARRRDSFKREEETLGVQPVAAGVATDSVRCENAMAWDDDASDGAIREGLNAVNEGSRGLLVMFICVHCPYVKHVEEELACIGRDYAGKVAMVAISSNDVEAFPQDGPEEMKKQAERLGFTFPYLFDDSQETAREFNAACTPDFFLWLLPHTMRYRQPPEHWYRRRCHRDPRPRGWPWR